MPEILTESFCERCGTRYTFESAAPRVPRLKGLRVVSRGLKNFVMSDDSSLDEAMAAARSDTEREQTAHQLDAFHKTFHFCMTCRQYTCGNCWNDAEGRCLTCAPHLGQEIMPAPFPALDAHGGFGQARNGNGHEAGAASTASAGGAAPMSWPTSDLIHGSANPGFVDGAPSDGGVEDLEPIDAMARLASIGADEDEPTAAIAAADAAGDVEPAHPTDAVASLHPAFTADATAAADPQQPEADLEPPIATDAATPAEPEQPEADVEAPIATAAAPDARGVDAPEPRAQAEAAAPHAEDAVTGSDDAGTQAIDSAAATMVESHPEIDVAVVSPTWAEGSDAEGLPVGADPTDAPVATADATPEDEGPAPSPASISEDDVASRASAAAAQTNRLLRRFRPGQSLDDEIAAFEAGQAQGLAEPGPAPEIVAGGTEIQGEPIGAAASELERVAAEPEPVASEPEQIAAARQPEADLVAAADPEPVAAAPQWPAAHESEPDRVATEPEHVAAGPEAGPTAAASERIAPWLEPEPAPEPGSVSAAPEPELVAAAPDPERVGAGPEWDPIADEPEPVAAEPEPVAAEPEPVAAEPERVAAEPERVAAEPEPVAAEPEPGAAAATPEPPARDDVVAQPTWRIVAPDPSAASPDPATPATGPVTPTPEPQWPTRPEWPARPVAGGLPFLDRPPVASGGIEALWAESAREVVTAAPAGPAAQPTGGIQPCVSCGLSLSATARFCRRCGTRQG